MYTFNRHFSFRNIIHIDILTQLKYIFNELLLWELLAIPNQPSVRLFAFSIRMLDFKMLGIRKPFGSSPDVTNRPNHRRHELNCVQPNVCLFFGFRFVYSHTQQSKGYQFREDTKYLCVICIANMKSTENKMSKHKSIWYRWCAQSKQMRAKKFSEFSLHFNRKIKVIIDFVIENALFRKCGKKKSENSVY